MRAFPPVGLLAAVASSRRAITVSTPAWLPAGAVAYADFVNGNYYADGAIRTIDEILIANEDWSGDWPVEGEPGASGLGTAANGKPVFSSIFGAENTGGSTYVLEFERTTASLSGTLAGIDAAPLPSWDHYWYLSYKTADAGASFLDYSDGTRVPLTDVGPNGSHQLTRRVAWTITPTSMAASENGGAVASQSGVFDISGLLLCVSAIGGVPWKSFTVYPPRPDADLPTLSAL